MSRYIHLKRNPLPMENGQASLPVLLFAFQVAVTLPVGVAVGEEGQESVVNRPHLVHNVHRLCRLQTKQEILNVLIFPRQYREKMYARIYYTVSATCKIIFNLGQFF
jgi:hypothetical protein